MVGGRSVCDLGVSLQITEFMIKAAGLPNTNCSLLASEHVAVASDRAVQ